jgi:hypothetical protein
LKIIHYYPTRREKFFEILNYLCEIFSYKPPLPPPLAQSGNSLAGPVYHVFFTKNMCTEFSTNIHDKTRIDEQCNSSGTKYHQEIEMILVDE